MEGDVEDCGFAEGRIEDEHLGGWESWRRQGWLSKPSLDTRVNGGISLLSRQDNRQWVGAVEGIKGSRYCSRPPFILAVKYPSESLTILILSSLFPPFSLSRYLAPLIAFHPFLIIPSVSFQSLCDL